MNYFFSDVHLGLGSEDSSRERERKLVRFLEMVGASAPESLWIVGDLFDYWFEYRSVIPNKFVRTLAAISKLVDAGVPVEYVIGNHDFGHRAFFTDELGVQVHGDDVERTIAGRRVYISHGDGKAFNDTGYLILKRVLRSPISNALFRVIHPDIGIGVASWMSRRSRQHTEGKDYSGGPRDGEADGLQHFAQQKITDEGFDLVVMGHNHLPVRRDYPGGTYINLGTWLGDCSYLVLDERTIELRRFEAVG
jgi:UDP-2,3-diacylglucosamine hydrolase